MAIYFGNQEVKKMWFGSQEVQKAWIGSELFYQAGTPLGDLPTGSIVRINENGVPAEFKVAQHNYIQSGVTAIERVLCLSDTVVFNSGNVNTYNGGGMDTFLTSTYRNRLEQDVQDALVAVNIPVTPGNGNYNLTTISRNVFVFSGTENGLENQYMVVEGSKVDIYTNDASRIKNSDDAPTTARVRWTRSAGTNSAERSWRVHATGAALGGGSNTNLHLAPVLTLPASFRVPTA